MKTHNFSWVPQLCWLRPCLSAPLSFGPLVPPFLFSFSTLCSPHPVCDWLNSCGVQQFMTLRQVNWPRHLTEYLRGILTQSLSFSLKSKSNYSSSNSYPAVCYGWIWIHISAVRIHAWIQIDGARGSCVRVLSGSSHIVIWVELVWQPWYPVLSNSAWLGAFEHPVVDQINQRIEDITGLDVSTAEDLQVALTWICIYLHAAPTPQHERFSQTVCACVCVLLGGELWRRRTVRTSFWLWAGKSLPVSWSCLANVAKWCSNEVSVKSGQVGSFVREE